MQSCAEASGIVCRMPQGFFESQAGGFWLSGGYVKSAETVFSAFSISAALYGKESGPSALAFGSFW